MGEERKLLNNISSEDIDELKDANDKEMQAHKLKKKEQEKKQETAKSMKDNRGG